MNGKLKLNRQLALAAVCFLIVINAFVVPVVAKENGKCGDNVSWNLNNGVLIISGKGQMYDYKINNLPPWYENRDNIVSVSIGKGVKNIGSAAFYDCSNLKTVSINDSVTSIGDYAFFNCESLLSVKMSNKITVIGNAAFKMCVNMKSITLPDTLEKIRFEAFYRCESLMSVDIPTCVTNMDESTFAYCKSLLQASVKASIIKLPTWTFYGCESLVNVYLNKSISDIGKYAFRGCHKLTSVNSSAPANVRNELKNKIQEDVPTFGFVADANGSSLETTYKPDNSINQQDVIENDSVSIGGSIESDGDTNLNMELNATIKNDSGWDCVLDKVEDYLDKQGSFGSTTPVDVNVSLEGNNTIDSNVLNSLAGKNVNLTIKGDIEYVIPCYKLDSSKKYDKLSLDFTLEKIEKPSSDIKKVIGDSEAYYLKFKGSSNFNIIIKLNFGKNNMLNFASLYQKSGSSWNIMQSVSLDRTGTSEFYIDGYDSITKYLIGINVKGVTGSNALIHPDSYDDYGGLTDQYGNKYVSTGIKSRWGLTFGQFTVIMFSVVFAIVAGIGGTMYVMNKRKMELNKIYEEVMSKTYDPEKHQREYRIIKRKSKKRD